jgi:phage baseplate assembly protein W
MTNAAKRFGTDLRLLPNLERENDRFPGSDLLTIETDEGKDLRTVAGVPNLQQALLLRFLTPRGALTHLGHPQYGSNLYKLLGELNTETNRSRAKLYALEALAHESRIAEVLSVTVTTDRRRAPTRIDISIRLRAVGEDEPVTVTVPVTLG